MSFMTVRGGVVVLALAVSVLLGGCASTSRAEPETTTFPFEGAELDVRSHETATELVATDRRDVRVTRWFDTRMATGVESSWSLREGRLDLRAQCTGFANCDARFRVEVPRGVRVLRDGEPAKVKGSR